MVGPTKLKPRCLRSLREGLGFGALGRNVPPRPVAPAPERLAADEAPDVLREAAELPLHLEKPLGVVDRRMHLGSVADDPLVRQQPRDAARVEPRHLLDVEAGEGPPVARAPLEDRQPREPRLGALEHEMLEEVPVVARRHAPLLVVVGEVERVLADPVATLGILLHDASILTQGRPAATSHSGRVEDRLNG